MDYSKQNIQVKCSLLNNELIIEKVMLNLISGQTQAALVNSHRVEIGDEVGSFDLNIKSDYSFLGKMHFRM